MCSTSRAADAGQVKRTKDAMTMSRRSLSVLATSCAAAALLATGAQASNDGKVLICHGTASATNPYVLIEVDSSALAGHFDGTEPGHGQNSNPDTFPVDGSCGGGGE
jgi:hypothetical protein